MLTLSELKRAGVILDRSLSGAVLQRIAQIDDFRLILTFYRPAGAAVILLTCRPGFARVGILSEIPNSPPTPLPTQQYLRAHLNRGICTGVSVASHDRLLQLDIRTRGGAFCLFLSVLGDRSNIYLVGEQDVLLHAMRPLARTRKELSIGKPWQDASGSAPSAGSDRWSGVPDELLLEKIEETYEQLERRKEFLDLARRIEVSLAREGSQLSRKLVNLLEDLGEARKADEHRHRGELLKGVLHRIRPGDDSVNVMDYRAGSEIVIRLNPVLTPSENLEEYFARYQKDLRGVAAIETQLQAAEKEKAAIEELQASLKVILNAPEQDWHALHELAAHRIIRRLLAQQRHPRRPAQPERKGSRRGGAPARLQPRRFLTGDGIEVLVGRSSEGNDYLTTRLARGNDLFFHLEGYPGSHVVLRAGGRTDPPPSSLLDACELAAHFSRLKAASHADVHVAPVKNVRKPRGAKPGLVYVAGGRTIHLRRDPKRLESILASRTDA